MRISKYIAHCGICSRRSAEPAVIDGRVKVNGKIIRELSAQVQPDDIVELDGKPIFPEERHTYIMLYKPEGYITTTSDEKGRACVLDLINEEGVRLVPVGRLDCATSGLLLLTNDMELVNRLTHPRHGLSKTYQVRIDGNPSPHTISRLRRGMEIEGYTTRPIQVRTIKTSPASTTLELILHEGRNRQIRKMMEQAGHRILSLRRTAVGSLNLRGLKKGEYRHLTKDEINRLR